MHRRHPDRRPFAVTVAAGLLIAAVSGCSAPAEPTLPRLAGATMGTSYSVTLGDPQTAVDLDELHLAVQAVLDEVNARMSTYDPESELSRFNRAAADDWFLVSEETAEVVSAALEASERTAGAFDVTVGPLVNLWTFGPDGGPREIPTDEAIAAAIELVGGDGLRVRRQPPALGKSRAEIYVDLSGIAKGHGVDRIAELLEERGLDSYFIDIGGEVRVAGTKPGEAPWRLAIEAPDERVRRPGAILELTAGAVATSGDYRNFFEQGGVRYSHMIDPRTGRPVTAALSSVSVVRPTCREADALATALLVLGRDAALAFAEREGIAVLLVERGDDGPVPHASTAFREIAGEDAWQSF